MTNWHLSTGNELRSHRETCRRFKSEITDGLTGVNCGRYLQHTFKFAINNRPFLYQDVRNLWRLQNVVYETKKLSRDTIYAHVSTFSSLCPLQLRSYNGSPLLAPAVWTSAPTERRLRLRIVDRRARVSHRLSIDPALKAAARTVAEGLNRPGCKFWKLSVTLGYTLGRI